MLLKLFVPTYEDSLIHEIIEMKDDRGNLVKEMYVPMSPYTELIIYKNRDKSIKACKFARGFLKTPSTETFDIKLASGFHFVVLRLKPFALYSIFGEKCLNKKNLILEIEGNVIFEELIDRLYGNMWLDEKAVKSIIGFLSSLSLKAPHESSLELAQHLAFNTVSPIYQYQELNKAEIHKINKFFTKEFGISPKQYQKIWRENKLESFFSKNNISARVLGSKFILKRSFVELDIEFFNAYSTLYFSRLKEMYLQNILSITRESPLLLAD